ncbi:MAG TPA: hypothetical protein VF148_02810 [Acidimicrobiia bacterium]
MAVFASVWFGVVGLGKGAVVWQTLSVELSGWLLPLAIASYLLGSTSSSSEWRQQTEEFLDSLPNGRQARILGRVMAAAAPVGYSVILVTAWMLIGARNNPAGEIIWSEVAVGPLSIAIAWTIGSLVGGFRRFRSAPSLFLVMYLFLQLLASPDIEIGASGPSQSDAGRLLMWLPPSSFESPFEILLRPSAQRLMYLVAVLVAVVLWMMWRADRSTSKRRWLVAATSVAMATVFVLGYVVASATPTVNWAAQSLDRPRADWTKLTLAQRCTNTDGIALCAYPTFEPWIHVWNGAITRAARLAPERVKGVAQRPSNTSFDGFDPGPGWVITGFSWDKPNADEPVRAFALAASAGNLAVGLPAGYQANCDAHGQGRSVVPLWLAATSVDNGVMLLRQLAEQAGPITSIGGVGLGNAIFGPDAPNLALDISEQPTTEVESVFSSRLSQLTDARTTIEDVASWFGISVRDSGQPLVPSDLPTCG